MRSVSKKTGVSKKAVRDRRILAKARREDREHNPVSEGIRRAAKRAGIEPPLDETPVTFRKHEIERLEQLLARAAESALDAAPREIPPMYGRIGAAAAIDAVRDIRMVRDELAKAMEGAP